jgi:hypothetical protein
LRKQEKKRENERKKEYSPKNKKYFKKGVDIPKPKCYNK